PEAASASFSRRPTPSAARHPTLPCRDLRFPCIDAGIVEGVYTPKLRNRRVTLVLLQNVNGPILSMGQSLLQDGLLQRARHPAVAWRNCLRINGKPRHDRQPDSEATSETSATPGP